VKSGYLATVGNRPDSTPSTPGDKQSDESPVSEYRDTSQEANDTRDLAAVANSKYPDANADESNSGQQPHAREALQKKREIVRVGKESASGTDDRRDSGHRAYPGCRWSPFPGGEPSAEQHLNPEGRNQNQDDARTCHNNWKFTGASIPGREAAPPIALFDG
jgi:hypothetical protein